MISSGIALFVPPILALAGIIYLSFKDKKIKKKHKKSC
ncbi:hypothetical protein AAX26_01862 [Aliarcobacter thereius]|nr:hypothetical protein AAX26_01862 [Aliarcobacter thereius]